MAKRQTFSRDFDTVAREIEQRIRKEELSGKRDALIASLREQRNVKNQQDVLESISQELSDDRKQYSANGEGARNEKLVLPGQ